ncbi:MAG: PHP domain-containing protein [Candidatus Adiutrix sp.]|jgi:predicted metal-dependent phosphoesterase TrpH|nr:PHP domain-containing protein [Candidatus Adiutrix sp.]
MPNDQGNAEAGLLDLHAHSRASDGALSPAHLAAAAAEAGLKALALTDHDTVDGLAEFLAARNEAALDLIGGVEISLEHSGTFHLLGLNVAGDAGIPAELDRLKTFRVERNLRMLDKIGRLGYRLPWEALLKVSQGGQMGRPHFAALLVERGFFRTRDEAFDKLLGKGRPGYVNKTRLSPGEGLAMIRAAGWAPVLAHPMSLGLPPEDWPAWLGRLKDDGLVGLEVYHPSQGPDQSTFFLDLARRFNLIPTAGSDFHGEAAPASPLGWTLKNSPLGREVLAELRTRI